MNVLRMTKANSRKSSNRLNNLDGKSWVKATKSWFVINPPRRTQTQVIHPAKFPEALVRRFVRFFTQENAWVLDPFAGIASTMIACKSLNRNSVGIELNPEFARTGLKLIQDQNGSGKQTILVGDSLNIAELISTAYGVSAPAFDYLITSPPYWNMLSKSRGGNETSHKERKKKGLKTKYSDSADDFGNIENYDEYIDSIGIVFDRIKPFLKSGAYLTIVIQNMRDVNGNLRTIAWDLANRISNSYSLKQEQIWCQDNKRLGCWGYPTTYVSNVHHHYCLNFQNA